MTISIYQGKDHRWRDAYNPLRGVSLPKVVSLLEAGERGQYADLQWFYHFMERSDAMIYSVLQRRRAALLAVDWDIRVCSEAGEYEPRMDTYGHKSKTGREKAQKAQKGATDGKSSVTSRGKNPSGSSATGRSNGKKIDGVLAEEQAAMLREAYDRIDNFRDAVSFLFTGFFRGYAHAEKHYTASGLIHRLEPVEQWFWVRDGMFGDWEYNKNAVSGRTRGIAIEPEDFLVFEPGGGALNRILSVLYLRKNLSQKDWDSYLTVYGIPSIFLVGPPNASSTREEEYQTIAEQLLSDGRGYLPNGSDIKYVNGGGTRPPFKERIDYIDRQITLTGTGGLLTMLSESGSGTLAGSAHQETFIQIARGDAVTLSGVLQRDIDVPLLNKFFPGQPVQAYFEFSPGASDESAQVVNDALKLAQAGYRMDPQEISEKTGYRVERSRDAALLQP